MQDDGTPMKNCGDSDKEEQEVKQRFTIGEKPILAPDRI